MEGFTPIEHFLPVLDDVTPNAQVSSVLPQHEGQAGRHRQTHRQESEPHHGCCLGHLGLRAAKPSVAGLYRLVLTPPVQRPEPRR